MIPYDELVAALQEWRAQKGLGVATARATRTSGQVAAAPPPYAPPPPQPGRGSGSPPAAPPPPRRGRGGGWLAAPPAAVVISRPVMDDYENADGTEIRDGALEDEIDVDAEAVDVIDEQLDEE